MNVSVDIIYALPVNVVDRIEQVGRGGATILGLGTYSCLRINQRLLDNAPLLELELGYTAVLTQYISVKYQLSYTYRHNFLAFVLL